MVDWAQLSANSLDDEYSLVATYCVSTTDSLFQPLLSTEYLLTILTPGPTWTRLIKVGRNV